MSKWRAQECQDLIVWACTMTILTIAWVIASQSIFAEAAPQYIQSEVFRCTNGFSEETFCLFDASCNHEWMTLASDTAIVTTGVTKHVTCQNNLVLPLQYTYNSATRKCSYSLDTGSLYASEVRIVIPSIDATQIWSHTTVDTVLTNPQIDITGDQPLCSFIRQQASYNCVPPYVNVLAPVSGAFPLNVSSTFCTLMPQVSFQCGTNLLDCQIAPSLTTYTCNNVPPANPLPFAIFDMSCSHVPIAQVGQMINQSLVLEKLGLNDWFHSFHQIAACTQMARTCVQIIQARDLAKKLAGNSYVPGAYENDAFECDFPFAGPFNTTLCETPATYQQVPVSCFGENVICFSPNGRRSQQTCRYAEGDLRLFCTLSANQTRQYLNASYYLEDQITTLSNQIATGSPTGRRLLALDPPPSNRFTLRHDHPRHKTHWKSFAKPGFSPRAPLLPATPWSDTQQSGQNQTAHPIHYVSHRATFTRVVADTLFRPTHNQMYLPIVVASRTNISVVTMGPQDVHSLPLSTSRKRFHWRQMATSLSPTPQQELAQLYLDKANADSGACLELLNTCGTNLNCTTDNLPLTSPNRMNRRSYCTSPVPTTCSDFYDMPNSPVSPFPQLSPDGTQLYSIQCVKTLFPLTYHNIQCGQVPEFAGTDCYFRCLLRSPNTLEFSAFPVPANVLLGANFTQPQKCAQIMKVAQSADVPVLVGFGDAARFEILPNFFECIPPYQTQSHVNSITHQTVIDNICVTSGQQQSYTMLCGDMNIVCTLPHVTSQSSPVGYTCVSSDYANRNALLSSGLDIVYLSATNVSLSVVAPNSQLSLMQRCVQLRDSYALPQQTSLVPHPSNYYCPTTTSANRLDNGATFCTTRMTRGSLPVSPPSFYCGSTSDVQVTCTLNNATADGVSRYTCTAQELSYLASHGGVNPLTGLAWMPYLNMSCTQIDSHRLLTMDQLTQYIAGNHSLGMQTQRCMDIKALCQGDIHTSSFACAAQYEQDSTQRQFCDPTPLDPPFSETFTCGKNPRYSIVCSNHNTALHGWYRCVNNATASTSTNMQTLLNLDCSVLISDIQRAKAEAALFNDTKETSEWVCELLRETCAIPIACNPVVDGFCPVPATTTLTCAAPAQLCFGYFCQLDASSRNGLPQSLQPLRNGQNAGAVDFCGFNPLYYNVTCNGFPISCKRQDTGSAVNVESVPYVCTHPYQTTQGFASLTRDMNMSCTVLRGNLDAANIPETCLRMGLTCASTGSIECSHTYLTSLSYPFCVVPSNPADYGGAFLCNGLLVTCVPASDINQVFCFSQASSKVWVLESNRDPVDFPSPPGQVGCTLEPRNFYLNDATRCGVLYDTCQHTCMNGFSTAPNTNLTNPSFCDDFTDTLQNFECDHQEITCSLLQTPGESTTVSTIDFSTYTNNADLDRYNRLLQCTHVQRVDAVFPNSLILNCVVPLSLFSQRPDTCQTLLAECLNNGGTIQCIAPYISTTDHPFCTQTLQPIPPDQQCDCDSWWSDNEGLQMIPVPLQDVSCYPTDFAAAANVNRAISADTLMTQCLVHQVAVPDALTCARRGYASYDQYLQHTYGSLYLTQAAAIYANEPWKKYWCVWSVLNPIEVCAVGSGYRLPLCTVECPRGLTRTSVNGSVAHYCCRDPKHCDLSSDNRNCVLGRHDPTHHDNPTVLPPSQGGPAYNLSTAAFPDSQCPRNLYWEDTIFPVSADFSADDIEQQSADSRQKCRADYRCYGFVLMQNIALNIRSVYYLARPPQFPTATLYELDPTRNHNADTNSVYHLHRSPQSQLAQLGTPVVSVANVFTQQVVTYVLERQYGYSCSDDRLSWTWYLDNNSDAMFEVVDRVTQHLMRTGANIPTLNQVISQLFFPLHQNSILTSNLQLTTDSHGNFIYAPLLVIDLEEEIENDIKAGYTVDNPVTALANISFTNVTTVTHPFGHINESVVNTQLVQVITQEFAMQHHVNYNLARFGVPAFGDLQWNFRRGVDMYIDLDNPFASLSTGFAADANDVWLNGWLDLSPFPNITQIRVATFWDLYAYFGWRHWVFKGSLTTHGYDRFSSSNLCTLNTPLWNSAPGNLCGVPICKRPPDPNWDWGLSSDSTSYAYHGGSSISEGGNGIPPLFPNMPYSEIQTKPRSIPCNGAGWCSSNRNVVTPGAGTCMCDASHQVYAPMLNTITVNGIITVPTALSNDACALDARDKCNNVLRGETSMCGGHGTCVVFFQGNRQQAGCECGHFPIDPAPSAQSLANPLLTCNQLIPRTCETHFLNWIPTGFEDAVNDQNLCLVPRLGCRNSPIWQRTTGVKYQRGQSYGCEVPPGNTRIMEAPGTCTTNVVVSDTDPNFETIISLADWSCSCKAGRYGTLCQYVTLNGHCYGAAIEKTLNQIGQIQSRQETCIWNPHLAQWEVQRESNIPPANQAGLPTMLCQGVICSGHGVCTHQYMNNQSAEVFHGGPNDAFFNYNQLGVASPAEQAFTQAVYNRLLAQKCTCQTGWTGPYCQTRTCVQPCLNNGTCFVSANAQTDPRIPTSCSCPTSFAGTVLVVGDQCQGPVCAGRGALVPDPAHHGYWTCTCRAPFYQGPSASKICDQSCVGTLKTQRSPSGQLMTLCLCTTSTGQQVLCSNTRFLQGGGTPSGSSSSGGFSNATRHGSSSGGGRIQTSSSSTGTTRTGSTGAHRGSTGSAGNGTSGSNTASNNTLRAFSNTPLDKTTIGLITGAAAAVAIAAAIALYTQYGMIRVVTPSSGQISSQGSTENSHLLRRNSRSDSPSPLSDWIVASS